MCLQEQNKGNTMIHGAKPKEPIYTDANGLVSLGLYKSKRAVYASINKGNLPHYKQGKRVVFKVEEVVAMLIPVKAQPDAYNKARIAHNQQSA
jgi:hypothetical protein